MESTIAQKKCQNINLEKVTEKQEKMKSKLKDSPIAIYEKRCLKNIEEKMAFFGILLPKLF